MIVGLSTFDTVFDRLSEEGADMAPSPRAAWSGIRGFTSGFAGAASSPQAQRSAEPFAAAYSEFALEAVAPKPQPKYDTTPFTRLSAAEIARDLGLVASDPPAELQRKAPDLRQPEPPRPDPGGMARSGHHADEDRQPADR